VWTNSVQTPNYLDTFVETIVTTSLSFIENLAKLKLNEASKLIFDLTRTEIHLLKAENSAPGKEVAFINKLNNLI